MKRGRRINLKKRERTTISISVDDMQRLFKFKERYNEPLIDVMTKILNYAELYNLNKNSDADKE